MLAPLAPVGRLASRLLAESPTTDQPANCVAEIPTLAPILPADCGLGGGCGVATMATTSLLKGSSRVVMSKQPVSLMSRPTTIGRRVLSATLAATVAASGCTLHRYDKMAREYCPPCEEEVVPGCGPGQLKIEEPCPDGCLSAGTAIPPGPDEIGANGEVAYWDLSLEEAVALALQQSEVMRDLGASVLRSPGTVRTLQDPAIAYSDPRLGEEAALSEFDAQLLASAMFDKNDRAFNNQTFGSNGVLTQDLNTYNVAIEKRTALGSQLAVRKITEYDYNNSFANRFGTPSGSWGTHIEAEMRQPLLQGAGLTFNRIAGPSREPGVMNGVLLARIRSDVSLADFEAGVRNLVSNVENAYWDLYFSYYDLQAKKTARDRSLELWRQSNIKQEEGDQSVADTSQALEQYWRFESDVRNAFNGRLSEGTSTNNGSSGGTFRTFSGGVRVAERRLRLIMGLPVNSYQLIRPASYPPAAPVKFDWSLCATEAVAQRPEIRRQRWVVKQRELELLASRNFLSPRLDVVGRYRWRGFGNDLLSQSDARFDNAYSNLASGDFQEWQVGVELEMPIGFRKAHTGVRNSELLLARERAILTEQERTVLYGLSNSFGEVQRAYEVLEAQWNRKAAAERQAESLFALWDQGTSDFDVVLEAQRRVTESTISFHQASVEYALALKNVHFEKGTLLEFNNVQLAESASDPAAYASMNRRKESKSLNYVSRDLTISRGPAPAGALETACQPFVEGPYETIVE